MLTAMRMLALVALWLVLSVVVWFGALLVVVVPFDQTDRCSSYPGGGHDPACGFLGDLAWYVWDGWLLRAACLLLVGTVILMWRHHRRGDSAPR